MIKFNSDDPLLNPPGKGSKYLFNWNFQWGDHVTYNDKLLSKNEITLWCTENFSGQFAIGLSGVYIYEEEDAMMMKLMWE